MATATTTIATATSATASATATCLNIAPGKDGYLPPEACDNLLRYRPSFAAAVIFIVLFGITTFVHVVQGIVYRKKFTWVVIMGGAWEIAAMVMGALLAKHQNSETYDTLHTILFLLAPLWINAFLYMTLGRMVWFFDEKKKLAGLSAQRFGSIFVWLDIFSFLIQATGAVLSSQNDGSHSSVMLGLHIYMGGIGAQEFFILIFAVMLVALHRRLIKQEQRGIMLERLHNGKMPWRWLFYGMYFALIMITIRIIFRICQYSSGDSADNAMLSVEAYEYVLDATPMFLALLAINFTHPGRIISGPDASWPRLSRKEKKELKRQRKAEKNARKKGIYYPGGTTSNSNSEENLVHSRNNSGMAEQQTPLNMLRYQEEGGQRPYTAPPPAAAVDHHHGQYDNVPPVSAYYPVHDQEAHPGHWEGYSSYDHARS